MALCVLQIAAEQMPNFACGSLLLVSELMKVIGPNFDQKLCVGECHTFDPVLLISHNTSV